MARAGRGRSDREARRRAQAYAVRQAVHADRGIRRRRDDVVAVVVLLVVAALATLAIVLHSTVGPGAPKRAPSPAASTPTAPSTAPGSASATPSAAPTPSAASTRSPSASATP